MKNRVAVVFQFFYPLISCRKNCRTDENGQFSLRVLRGLKGKLFGEVWLDENEFTECPQIVALLKAKGEIGWLERTTDTVEIQIQGNVDKID